MSQVEEMLAEFRRLIDGRDLAVQRELIRRWRSVEQALAANIDAVVSELAALRAAGQPVNVNLIYRMERYRTLLAQVDAETQRYTRAAAALIEGEQRYAVQLGLDWGTESVAALAAQGGLGFNFDRVSSTAVNAMIGYAQDGTPLARLLAADYPHTIGAITDRLVEATALGYNPRKTARLIRDEMAGNAQRALVVARTEQARAMRAATVTSYQQSGVVRTYTRRAARSGRTCLACLLEDGRQYPVDVVFSDHPNGRCLLPGAVVAGPIPTAFVSRYYQGDAVSISTASGKLLAVTPNHPVLTDRGWVAAQFIQKGDNVVGCSPAQGRAAGVTPDGYQVPTRVEDVPRSLGMYRLGSVPCAAEHFHGDGGGSEVYVVWADSLLRDRGYASFGQPISQQALGLGDVASAFLTRLGDLAAVLEGLLETARSLLGDAYPAQMLLVGSGGSEQAVGFGHATEGNATGRQDAMQGRARSAEALRQSVLRLTGLVGGDGLVNERQGVTPGLSAGRVVQPSLPVHGLWRTEEPASLEFIRQSLWGDVELKGSTRGAATGEVQLDRVLEVGLRHFSGHVYNLQNAAQWYSADSIITHNCTAIPDVPGVPSPFTESGREWLEAQPAEVQRQVMGNGHYEAWKAGEFRLENAARMHNHPVWGEAPQVVPLKELVSRGEGFAVAAG
jgi:hypothetical protein